jgi:arylsulfatase A-like enzyme
LPKKFPVYPDLLEQSGYVVGFMRKGWGPGNFKAGGRDRNPAGPKFNNFVEFLKSVPADKPFCFWFGSNDPHRPYDADGGERAGIKIDNVKIPPFWPDNATSRTDVINYYSEVQRFDKESGEMLDLLQKEGRLDNTIVVMSGDNGWPFPRCKANLYDGGTRQPLAVRWPAKIKPDQVSDDFINLMDLAPTFLEAANLKPPPEMTGRSFLGLLTGQEKSGNRNTVFVERERHAYVRARGVGYPARAIRTRDFLYIRNFRPDRWPAGDPDAVRDPKRPFADCDDGPTKRWILAHRDEEKDLFNLCFGKRPGEELYDLKKDPHNIKNVANDPAYAKNKARLRSQLDQWMRDAADPRATKDDDHWDNYPYFGGGGTKQ